MLQITIPASELWNEVDQEFNSTKETKLMLEHSLISLSKWESKWHVGFLSKNDKTIEETTDYIRCMTLTRDVDPKIYAFLTDHNISQVNEYISSPMTATSFVEDSVKQSNNERITSELIYYWMVALNIPFECQKWHLNRLLTLVRVCNIKNQPPKKTNRRETTNRNAEINAARKAQLNTTG